MNIGNSWVLESDADYETHDNRYDKGYKYLLSVKKVFVELLRSFVKQGWVSKIDEDNVERIDKSFILSDFKEKEADLVYKVKFDGKEVFFYILLELQSTVDFQMPYRLLQYMMEIWRTILHDTEKNAAERKDFKLPIIVPCVLYNGKYEWTACRSFRETLEANEIFGEYILDFEYILFDVKRYSEQELLKLSNLIGAVFFVDKKPEYNEILLRIKNLADKFTKLSEEDWVLFRIWLKNTLLRGLPKGNESEDLEKVINNSKEDVNMVYAIEEALKKEFQRYEERGIERGIEKGIERGRIEGIEKGIEKDKIEVVIRASKKGFAIEDIAELIGMNIAEVEKVILENEKN